MILCFWNSETITNSTTLNNEQELQENGLAERMNRTSLERVKYMLSFPGLPRSFWAKAVSIACYFINTSPSSALGLKPPMEIWLGHSANYENLDFWMCGFCTCEVGEIKT